MSRFKKPDTVRAVMKTVLRIISVLMLLTGIVSLAAGGINIGVIYEGLGGTAVGSGIAAALNAVVVVLLIIGGLTDLICGLLGLRAAKRHGGSTAAVVFGVIAVIPGGVSLALDFSMQRLLGIIIPALYLICCIIMKSGGRDAA